MRGNNEMIYLMIFEIVDSFSSLCDDMDGVGESTQTP